MTNISEKPLSNSLLLDSNTLPTEGEENVSRSQSGDVYFVANHTAYQYKGGENYEHDDTGGESNYSGCVDDVYNAQAEHDGWQEGYDY